VTSAWGENDLFTALNHCHQVLDRFTGDRVVALFGDGDLNPKAQVLVKIALMKAENIRFVTRGLGPYAAREFGDISDEESSTASIDNVAELAEGIADMATSLKRHGLTR
jgi:class 3 adenylate cyclase